MAPYLAMVGEFRVHYAGFFDPGFGHARRAGSRGVLEVRCHEAPFVLEHGQVVGRLVYERMAAPERALRRGIASNYQGHCPSTSPLRTVPAEPAEHPKQPRPKAQAAGLTPPCRPAARLSCGFPVPVPPRMPCLRASLNRSTC